MLWVVLLLGAGVATPAPGQREADPYESAIELYFAGEIGAAAEEFERLARELAEAGDLENAARGFNNACLAQGNVGQLESAVRNCRSAVELRRQQGNVFGEARALNNLALAHQRAGDLQRARQHFREALDRNLAIEEREGAVINRQNLAALAWARGRYDESLDEFRRAEQLSLEADAAWSAAQIRISRQNQGAVLATLGNDREALEIYLALLEDDGVESPVAERAPLEYNTAVAYASLGDAPEALRRLERSQALSEQVEDGFGAALAQLYRGWLLHDSLGRDEEAVATLEAALQTARRVGGVAEEEAALGYLIEVLLDSGRSQEAASHLDDLLALSEQSEQAGTRWTAAAGAARLASARGDLDEALDWARQAVAAVERTGVEVAAPSDRARFVRSQRRVYGLAVELFTEGHLAGREGALEEALRVALRAKARDLFSRLDLEIVVDELTLVGLRERLDDALLIELFDSGEALWRFAVSADRATVVEIRDRTELLDAGDRVAGALALGAAPDPDDLERLAVGLLGDLTAEARRLLVAPVASLARLPWEILPIGNGRLLVDDSIVGYLPSAALLLGGAARTEPRDRWLAVASQGPPNPPTLRPLAQLESVDEEVDLLRQLGGAGAVLMDGRATADEVLERLRSPGADVAHLAVHAIVDERPGYGSMLLLEDRAVGPDDLIAAEINVGLAVLAACSTTLGSDPSGLVLQSLTGAWLAAGAQSVVATLWDVDDQTSLAFMEQFYAQLERGLEPAEALAAAKRRLRSDPRWEVGSWSAYVLTGAPGERSGSVAGSVWLALGLLAVALSTVAWIGRRRRAGR